MSLRIAIHDYAGHPFVFGLSRELAAMGHEVRHFFFAGDAGPKGDANRHADDPPTFSVEPLSLPGAYRKDKLFDRRAKDIQYGRIAAERIAAFRPDVVLSGNTPLEAQGVLVRAVRRSGAAFLFWMQDFYSLAVTRLLGRKWFGVGAMIAAHYRRLERRQLKSSDAVVLISDGFRQDLARFRLAPARIHTIPNWGALESLPLRPKRNAWSKAQGVGDRFVFLYSGTLGLKHDPLLLLDLADAFAGDPEVAVVVASAGTGVEALRGALDARPRPNLQLKPLQPVEVFPDVLGGADVLLGLLERGAGEFSVPSKVLSYLCAGRPVILSAPPNNLAAVTVVEAEAGLVVQAGDGPGLVDAARRLRADPELRRRAGEAGRAYAERHFDLPAVARRFVAVFEETLANRRAGAPTREPT